ncbi:MAG: UDP-N-acetylmuramoyl-tripeptide--D-alanyl-D-alanine ligase [Opitutaceae bacterium]|jgi:UDP-N-acetylmuramoyl-tripeptide--D-alanyl-D-alanine ligase|nr:UDP-N-acetylmuramoyl-tripeptide--D-alanyl-D-alanine ligase [Opitutaceae bacterium]
MPTFAPQFLAAATSGRWTREPAASAPVTGFTVDTRRLAPGQCFVALKTGRRDGHDFLKAAASAGAAAALVSKPDPAVDLPQLVVADPLAAFQAIAAAHRRTFTGPVVGVTGSAGKTSTKELLALLLSERPGDVLATTGNLNNHLGVPLTLTRLEPGSHACAVIEAGIGAAGDMTPLAKMIAPDHAIVTLVGPAHLAELGSLANVAREKSVLPAATLPSGLRVFPAATLEYAAFRELPAPTLALESSISHEAEETRVRFALSPAGGGAPVEHVFTSRRVSDGMASNAALALATALRLGVTPAEAQARLAKWQPAALRGELCQDHAGRWLYVDCYNANPASMHDALDAFAAMAPAGQPRLYLIGGMEELGSDAVAYHRRLGEALARHLRLQDRALVLATPELANAVVAGASTSSVAAAPDLAALRLKLEAHDGAVFIKGSRRYQLESLLLPNAVVAETTGTAPAH